MISPRDVWNRLRGRTCVVPRFARIPATQVEPKLLDVDPVLPRQHYFAVAIDEMFLHEDREWWKEYDPTVLAVSEFTYGGKDVTLPFVVGPKLMEKSGTPAPQGMLYKRTRVTGIHPFRGGRVVSTIVLCRVKRTDHARRMLQVMESMAGAIPFGSELGTYGRLAGSLLDGIDMLMGEEATEALVGIRQEFDHDLGSPISPGYYVLIDGPEAKYPLKDLWVQDGALMTGSDRDHLVEFRKASYVLFSTRSSVTASDTDKLPFAATERRILDLAISEEAEDWKRAKAEMLVLLREMLSSPDLTRTQAETEHARIVADAVKQRAKVQAIGHLSAGPRAHASADESVQKLRAGTALLDL